MPQSFPKSVVVGRSSVIDAPVVPDRHIVGIHPPMPDLQVVILDNEAHEPVKQCSRLKWGQSVDVLHVVSNCKHGFPSGHGICADNRMHGDEIVADVLGGAPWGGVQFEIGIFSRFGEFRLCVGCIQRFKEFLIVG